MRKYFFKSSKHYTRMLLIQRRIVRGRRKVETKNPMGKMHTIFKKNRCPTSRIAHEKKNRMCRNTIFRNYCHYYNRHDCSDDCSKDSSNDSNYGQSCADACDFYSHVGCAMLGTVFKKKSSFMDDDDAKVRAALPGAKKR